MAKQRFQQKGDEQFPVDPRAGGLLVGLGKMPETYDRLKPLEHKLDLPSSAIKLQNARRADRFGGKGREDEDVDNGREDVF